MRETEFREWLEANGANSVSGRNTRVYAVKTIESNLGALGFSQSDLDAVWAEKQFEILRETLAEIKADAAADGQRYRILMPQSQAPVGRLSSWRSWLGQYGRFLEGGGVDMTDAGLIRRHVLETYIEPARTSDQSYAELVVKDVNDALGLNQAWPNICQALKGRKFLDLADVPPPQWFGADQSTATRFRFDVDRGEYWALTELIGRYGAPIAETKKMASFQMKDGRQVALDLEATRAQLWLEGTVEPLTAGAVELQPYAANAPRHSNLPPRLKHSGSDPEPVTMAIVRNSEDLQLLLDHYETGGASLDRQNLNRLKARFLSQFPDFERNGGFSSDEWREKDDPHRVHTMKEITALKQRGVSTSDLGTQVLDLLGDKRNIHLQHFARQRILETIRTAHPGVLEEAMGKLVAGDGYPSQLAGQFLHAVWPLLQEAATGSNPFAESRIFASLPLALAQPDEAISINYQRFQTFARALCHRALFANAPLREEEYAEANSLARKTLDIMRDEWGWRPRDLWDVQSFIWSTCGSALEDTAGELDPTPIWIVTARYGDEDGLPRFIERGEFSLLENTGSSSNKRMAEMRAGDHIFLRDYFHQTHDLPFDANGGRVSAIRIRAKGRIVRESEDGLNIGVEWDEPAEARVWYFYTFTDPVWGLKPPGERPSADLLRRFLLLGEDQDYDWFLNDPFWRDRLFGKPKKELSVAKPTNLILYGPPGTGKTYRTAQEAVRLCDGDADYGNNDEGRAALMARYGELVKEKRIEFVTFHQNFGYEDFVEGLRPTTGTSDGQTLGGFELKPEPGIFRRIADRAAAPVMKADDAFSLQDRSVFKLSLGEAGKAEWEWVFEDSLEEGYAIFGFKNVDWSDERFRDRDAILRELHDRFPDENLTVQNGDVKSPDRFRNRIREGDVVIVSKGLNAFRAIGVVEGPYEYAPRPDGRYCHRRKVHWLWDDPEGVDVREISEKRFSLDTVYELPKSRLNIAEIERLVNAAAASEVEDESAEREPHVLIIDEINRANISKVFGELITLLEPDKRLGQPNALTVRLPYSKREFGVPSNLHVIGTMNTADRSIALLDTALRRRFRFEEIAPEPWRLGAVGDIPLAKVLTVINERIEYLIDRDHRIGHAFFMGDGGKERRAIDATMRDKVIPLLQEYFFEDWSRIASVVGDGFLKKTVLKAPPGIQGEARDSWAVRETFLTDAYDRLLKGALPDEGEGAPTDDDGDE